MSRSTGSSFPSSRLVAYPVRSNKLRSFFEVVLARDAGFDAEQRMGLVCTLVEGGFAGSGFGFFRVHC